MTGQFRINVSILVVLLLVAGYRMVSSPSPIYATDDSTDNATGTASVTSTAGKRTGDGFNNSLTVEQAAGTLTIAEHAVNRPGIASTRILSHQASSRFDPVIFKAPEGARNNDIKRIENLDASPGGTAAAPPAVGESNAESDWPARRFEFPDDHSTATLDMYERQSLVIEFNGWTPITFDSSEVLDLEVENENHSQRILFKAGQTGFATVTFMGDNGRTRSLNVRVVEDMRELLHLLNQLYPDAKVEVYPVKGAVLLRGIVEHPEQIEEIIEIADQFAPSVLNQLQCDAANLAADRATLDDLATPDDTVPVVIPPGMRVLTFDAELSPAVADSIAPGLVVDFTATPVVNDSPDPNVEPFHLKGVTVFAVSHSRTASATGKTHVSVLVSPEQAQKFQLHKRRVTIQPPAADAHEAKSTSQSVDGTDSQLLDEIRELRKDVRKLTELLQQRHGMQSRGMRIDLPQMGPVPLAFDFAFPLPLPEAADGEALVVVVADWCNACRTLQPIIEALTARGVPILKLNLDTPDGKKVANEFSINALPTILRVRDGRVIGQHVGVASEQQIFSFYWGIDR